ncbi:hypothetical protein [Streptomyces sp. NPDC001933]|uniref:hypothetical protein n=1 Tax=Streptomyces sp. NPDC001933 TaxID=3364626 RepID=UPI0036C254C1
MASGLLPSRPTRCVACLVLTAGAALGATAGEAPAGQGSSGRPTGPRSSPAAPSTHTSAGTPARPSGVPGTGPSAEEPATPAPAPTAVHPDGGPAAPAPPGPPPPPAPASGSPAGSATATASTSPSPSSSSTDDSASGSDPDPDPASGSGSSSGSDSSSDPGSGSSSSSASDSASSDGEPPADDAQSPLAGREAGEGRLRPGRQLSAWEFAHPDGPLQNPYAPPAATDPGPTPTPGASTSDGADQLSRQALDSPAVRQVKQLSLGAGIALVGLGLGFLAYRMRRAD